MRTENNIHKAFQNFFLDFDENFFNLASEKIIRSKEIKLFSHIVPKWFEIFKKGINSDQNEVFRTLKHTIRTLYVYYSIMNNQFECDIKETNIKLLKNQLEKIYNYNSQLFPLILLFHDIGRPFNRTWHNIESKKIIQNNSLLDKFNLGENEKYIILTVIEQHLLLGTIFTGESSYLGSISLWNSINNLGTNLSNADMDLIFNSLYCFTLIDIWGYEYSTIYDHYFDHYSEIRQHLANIFKKAWDLNKNIQEDFLQIELSKLDFNNLKWRIACSLRIFQFVNTKDYLTRDFYFSKIEEGLQKAKMGWEKFEKILGQNHPKIQFKYALPIMMILATEKFKRKSIEKNAETHPKIFQFWKLSCEKLNKFLSKNNELISPLCYYVFNLPRTWFSEKKYIDLVKSRQFIINIKKNDFQFNREIFGYLLNIQI